MSAATVALYRKATAHDPDLPIGVVVPDDTLSIYYHWALRLHVAVTPDGQVPLG